ncbi:MAG: hypothetical protein BJ554DRAFT_7451 [Olpidium bornovanus]|uniref:Uncharacterized protein n=1 Tax=Olpidium bornovanus TaxID=278681 RepID=A0A8H7ZVS2_9FUNG|nr:MAG: hypothetical protein BJ554DRAFT_7451 [Olpidium bornovanus]
MAVDSGIKITSSVVTFYQTVIEFLHAVGLLLNITPLPSAILRLPFVGPPCPAVQLYSRIVASVTSLIDGYLKKLHVAINERDLDDKQVGIDLAGCPKRCWVGYVPSQRLCCAESPHVHCCKQALNAFVDANYVIESFLPRISPQLTVRGSDTILCVARRYDRLSLPDTATIRPTCP